MKLRITDNTQQESSQLQPDELEQSLTELYQAEMECVEAEIEENQRERAVENLLDVAAVAEQHGMPKALVELVNEDGQLESFLGMTFSEYESEEELGKDVSQAVLSQILNSDGKGDQISIESVESVLIGIASAIGAYFAVVLALFASMTLADQFQDTFEKLYKKMQELWENHLSDENVIDEQRFDKIQTPVSSSKVVEQLLKGLFELGQYLSSLAESDDAELDREKLNDLLEGIGGRLNTNDKLHPPAMVNGIEWGPSEDWPTLAETGWTSKDVQTAFKNVMEYLETAQEHVELYAKAGEEAKEKIKELKEQEKEQEDVDKQELKEKQQRIKLDRDLIKEAIRTYGNDVRVMAQQMIRIGIYVVAGRTDPADDPDPF